MLSDQRGTKPSYVLLMLWLTYFVSLMDRQVMSILMEDIRLEFRLSDTQLGLLSGLAFAIFYSTLGIPVARLADKVSRVKIITVALSLWSVMTVMCGFATSFGTLFLARMGVGVGESGSVAPSHSLLADVYDERELPRALGIFGTSTTVGAIAGLILGGLASGAHGWRTAFLVCGAPGLLLAVALAVTVKEPPRGRYASAERNTASIGIGSAVALLGRNGAYVFTSLGQALATMMGYMAVIWVPAMLQRKFGLSVAAVIPYAAAIYLGSLFGGLIGGSLAARLRARSAAAPLRMASLGMLIATPFFVAGYGWASTPTTTSIMLFMGCLFIQLQYGPAVAAIQTVVSVNNRALASSIVVLLAAVLGLIVGPFLVGALSDHFAHTGMEPSRTLNTSLSVVGLFSLLSGATFWIGATKMRNREDDAFGVPAEARS